MLVALVNPEIPQNTGSIARTCAATGTPLHLIGKLGFEISEKRVRRAGLDYWPYVSVTQHSSWELFEKAHSDAHTFWFFSRHADSSHFEANFQPDDILVFGSETKGLGSQILQAADPKRCLRIPMTCPQVRSLNLSNAVSIALYEAIRQTTAPNL